jgi:hypothetical protein
LKQLQEIVDELRELHTVSWVQLHTGYWKDIDIVWRQVYSLSSLLLACCIGNEFCSLNIVNLFDIEISRFHSNQ